MLTLKEVDSIPPRRKPRPRITLVEVSAIPSATIYNPTLKPVEHLPGIGGGKHAEWVEVVKEFYSRGSVVAELDQHASWRDANAIRAAVVEVGLLGKVKVFDRRGRVFMTRIR